MEYDKELANLKESVKTLTEAVRVLSEKDDRAQVFIERVEELLGLEREAQARTDERVGNGD